MVINILAKTCKRHYTLDKFCGITPAVSVPQYVFEMLLKLLMNACMSDLWVRQGLSQGVLLRSLGSFLRCDDTLVHSGSVKSNVRKLNLLLEP